MDDVFKKFFNLGIEMQNKVIDLVDELVSEEETQDEKNTDLLKDIKAKLDVTKEKGEKLINDIGDSVLGKSPIATQSEVDELRNEIKTLAERINALEGQLNKNTTQTKK